MKQRFQELGWIIGLAILWGISGYLIGTALQAVGLNSYPLGIIVASVNVILGMLWLKDVIHDPTGDKMFFQGPARDEPGDVRVGCLWAVPFGLAFIGVMLWFWVIIIRLIDK